MIFKIYGKPNCKYCEMAKDLLKSRKKKFEYVDISENDEAMDMMIARGFRSVPQIYYDDDLAGDHIGGYNDLVNFLNSN